MVGGVGDNKTHTFLMKSYHQSRNFKIGEVIFPFQNKKVVL